MKFFTTRAEPKYAQHDVINDAINMLMKTAAAKLTPQKTSQEEFLPPLKISKLDNPHSCQLFCSPAFPQYLHNAIVGMLQLRHRCLKLFCHHAQKCN